MIFVICYLAFLSLAFVLRLAPLGRYATPDEPAWVYRSIRFADALAARDWAAIPSTGHPGVTTMWLGTLSVSAQRLLRPAESATHLDWINRMAWLDPENGQAFRLLAFFLPGGRIAVALTTTLGLAALYPLLTRLFDRRLVLLTIGLLAFDPFFIGHSSLIHTDALLATFTLLALATALNGLREPRRAIWWALSGLFTGLALLTKTPAIVLLPFIGLIQLIAHLRQSQISNLKSLICHLPLAICHFSAFILVTAATCVALYPALWANPAETFSTLFAFTGRHVEMAQRPIFFAGQMTYDPGPLFYPAVLLFRISPIALAGLVIGLIALRRLPTDYRFAFLTLIAFSIGFGMLMSLGVKKHDRYLLPALPPLTLAATLGIGILVDWCTGKLARSTTHRFTKSIYQSLISQSPIILQALIALAFLFHPLTYANPLAGGPWIARRVLDLDWGEAMGEAARWLNRQPNAERLTVVMYPEPTFASVFKGRVVPMGRLSQADYLVRGCDFCSPDHIVTLNEFCIAICPITVAAEQATYLANHADPGNLILLDADTPLLRQYTGPGTIVSLADLPTQAAVAERLNELVDDHSGIWLVADPAASPFTAAYVRQSIEAVATPIESESVGSGTITRFTMRSTPTTHRQLPIANFGHHITLVDAQLPSDPTHFIHTLLRWQAPTPTPMDLHAHLYLLDENDHLWSDVGQLVLNDFTFPTTQWDPGAWSDQNLRLTVPDRIPPGTYAVKLTVTDDASAQLGAWDAEGAFQGVRVVLGQVEIAPPSEPAGQTPCLEGRELTAEPFTACITKPPRTISSGDALAIPTMWSATTSPEADYRVRWRLVGDGMVALEHIAPLSAYATSNWRHDDAFDAYYALRIDPNVPAGTYGLALNVIDPDSNPLWTEDETIGTVEILHRDRQFDLPDDIGHPLDLTLGNIVHLRGFDLDATDGAPGDTLPLILYWQGDSPTDINYTVFVHLVGPDGLPHGQLDVFPGDGSAPTTSWAQGQVVVDKLALPIAGDAAPGTYHIAVGLYDAASGGRLPVTNDSGQRLPNDQIILPIEITIGSAP